MKFLLPIYFVCIISFSAFSQRIQLVDMVNEISTQAGSEATNPLKIKNISDKPIRLSISKINSDLTSSQAVQLCYRGVCDSGNNLDIITILPGETLNQLELKFNAGLDESESSVEYLFVDLDYPQKTIPQTFTYKVRSNPSHGTMYTGNGIKVSDAYPNPAQDYALLDFDINNSGTDAKIILHNVLGNAVSEFSLKPNETSLKIPTDNLAVGVYFYTLNIGNKGVVTKKLIVRK